MADAASAGLVESPLQKAFDPYAFVRNAWMQRREYQVKDGDVPEDEEPLPDDESDEPADAGDQPADVVSSSISETSLMPASAAATKRARRAKMVLFASSSIVPRLSAGETGMAAAAHPLLECPPLPPCRQ